MSSRFAVAVHVLTLLTLEDGGPVPSTTLAESVNTNPAVIRQIMARLREAGMVGARFGKGGGSTLACDPTAVTLLDVYHATELPTLVDSHCNEPSNTCVVGRHICDVLDDVTARAESAFFRELRAHTIDDVVMQIRDRSATTPATAA